MEPLRLKYAKLPISITTFQKKIYSSNMTHLSGKRYHQFSILIYQHPNTMSIIGHMKSKFMIEVLQVFNNIIAKQVLIFEGNKDVLENMSHCKYIQLAVSLELGKGRGQF